MRRISRYVLPVFFFLVFFATAALAEEITITTYYPSPYGSYNELQLYPHPTPVATCNSSNKGTMYYDSDDEHMYVCNGSAWKMVNTDSNTVYTHYCYSSSAYGSPTCVNAGGAQGYCPSGYTQKANLGAWGYCATVMGLPFVLPPGGSCGSGYITFIAGDAYVCAQ